MSQLPECDYCESTDSIIRVGDSNTCPNHRSEGAAKLSSPISRETPDTPFIQVNEVLRQARNVDASIQVKTDLFNAETVSLDEIKKAISADESIVNKPYALAQEVLARYKKFQETIFELKGQMDEALNKQRATQIYLNNLANQLRAEEREQFKIHDINYKPRPVTIPVSKKNIKNLKNKIDVKELRARASELGIAEFTFKMVLIQKNLTVQQGYELFKASLAKAKTDSIPPSPPEPLNKPVTEIKVEVETEEIVEMDSE